MNEFSAVMQTFFVSILVILAVLILFCLIYAMRSLRFTDKIVAGNMIGSIALNIIVIFAVYLGQDYILDIGIAFTLLSFLAVIVLCRVVTDHIFGQMRHLKDKQGKDYSEAISKAGTEDHDVTPHHPNEPPVSEKQKEEKKQ